MFNFDGCGFTDLTIWVTTNFYFITFYIILPYYLTIGLISNIILVYAFGKNLKTEPSLAYQMFVVCSKTYETLIWGWWLAFSYWWAGLGGDVANWFVSNYSLMFFTFQVMLPLFFLGIFMSLLGTVAMVADRVLVLCRPIFYQHMNHRVHKGVAFSIILVLSVSMSIDLAWLYDFVPKGNSTAYALIGNKHYVATPFAQAMAAIRTVVRLSMVFLIIVLNVIVVVLYKRRMIKIESTTLSNQAKAQARKEANRDLVILCVCQSCLTSIDQIPHAINLMLRQVSVYWDKCSFVMVPEVDASFLLSQALEFFVIVIINKSVRHMVTSFRWWKALCQCC